MTLIGQAVSEKRMFEIVDDNNDVDDIGCPRMGILITQTCLCIIKILKGCKNDTDVLTCIQNPCFRAK